MNLRADATDQCWSPSACGVLLLVSSQLKLWLLSNAPRAEPQPHMPSLPSRGPRGGGCSVATSLQRPLQTGHTALPRIQFLSGAWVLDTMSLIELSPPHTKSSELSPAHSLSRGKRKLSYSYLENTIKFSSQGLM